jgi:hypothetical protein
VAGLAARQHGVVARRQLRDLGLTAGAIGRRLRGGRLHALHPGVYAVGHTSMTQQGRWLAAVLFCGPGAVLSHRSAAALWGIRDPTSGPVEVTAPKKSRSREAIRRHFAALPPDEIRKHDGISVSSVPRTLFDLATVLPAPAVESALRQSEYLRLHDRLSLPHLLDRYPRHRGAKAIRACLSRRREASGNPHGWLEERFLPFLDCHRLPRPQLNVWLEVGGRRHQVDCLWPDVGVVVELDGFAAHGTRVAFSEDRARDRRLRVAGYAVTRVAPEQLDEEPGALAADLRVLVGNTSVRDNIRSR